MSKYDDIKEFVETSVIDQYEAPDVEDTLHSDIPEDKQEAAEGLDEATDAADHILEGQTLNQWQAEGDVESQTNAAVAAGETKPRPAQTVGEADHPVDQRVAESYEPEGVRTSVVDQYGAPNRSDFLHSDIPETTSEARRGMAEATIAADDQLTGQTENQWQAWNNAESLTDAAVAAGRTEPRPAVTVGEESHPVDQSVAESYQSSGTTTIIDQYGAEVVEDLHSDIPEDSQEEADGLKEANDAADHILEGQTLNQWQAEGDVESQTDAAVADNEEL